MRTADRAGLLIAAAAGVACGAVLAMGGLPVPVTGAAGLLLAMVLPGYALTRALFPGRSLQMPERIVLTLGLDLAVGVVTGFLLHLLPPGLSAGSWGLALGGITVAACAAAWLREDALLEAGQAPATGAGADAGRAGRASPTTTVAATGLLAGVPPAQLSMLAAAGVLVTLALVVARAGVMAQPRPGFSSLWLQPGEGDSVRVGVADHEGRPEAYRLVVSLDGRVVARLDDIAMADGVEVIRRVDLPPAGAILRHVAVSLWRAGDAEGAPAYRAVDLAVRGGAVAAVGAPAAGSDAGARPVAGEPAR